MERNREWIIILGFGLLSLGGWQRLIVSLANMYWLTKAGVTPGPVYLALSGSLWGLLGLLGAGWLLLRRGAYRGGVLGIALLFAITYWIDRFFISRAGGMGQDMAFSAMLTLLGLAYTTFVLRPWQKQTRFSANSGT